MELSAFILTSTPSLFGGMLSHLFVEGIGKIVASFQPSLCQTLPSSPALIEIDLVREKKGLYKAKRVQVEDTFPQIRTQEHARLAWIDIAELIKRVAPSETPIEEFWPFLLSLIPCIPVFQEKKTAYFLVAYYLASLQGIDLSWLELSPKIDRTTKDLLLSFPNSHTDIFTLKCPEEGLTYVLEELGIYAKGGT